MSLLDHTDFGGDAYRTCALSMSSDDMPLRNDVVIPALDVVRQDISAVVVTNPDPEASPPEYSSDDIDQGTFGMRWHPVSGTWMEGAQTVFEPINRTLILATSSSGGWSPSSAEKKELPRIGDGKPHTVADFPLVHWNFDPQTGIPLKK